MNIYENTRDGIRIEIREDDNPISPRAMNANIGKMICFHRRYLLGDRHDYRNKDEFLEDLLSHHFGGDTEKADEFISDLDSRVEFLIPPFSSEKMRDDVIISELEKDHVILPVFLLDHSGLAISTLPFGDPWDSGQVGWIYADRNTVIEEYGEWSAASRQKTEEFMRGEVREYDDYLRGENYIYDMIDVHTGEILDGGVWTGDIEKLEQFAWEALPEAISVNAPLKGGDAR